MSNPTLSAKADQLHWAFVADNYDEGGKRHRQWFSGYKSQADAKEARARKLTEKADGVDLDANKITVGDVLTRWLETRKSRVAARTYDRYAAIIRLHIRPALGEQRLSKVKPLHIERLVSSWAAAPRLDKKKGVLSPRSVAHNLETLKSALRWGARRIRGAHNPADGIEPPRAEGREMRTIDAEGFIRLIAAMRGSELEVPVVVAFGTGVRRGELLALRWSDIDLAAGRLSVRRSLERVAGQIRTKEPKTPRSRRTVALPAFTITALRTRKDEQLRNLSALLGELEASRRQKAGWVFDRIDGNPWDPGAFSLAFYRLVRHAKLPAVRFHDLRHSYGTLALAAGTDLKTISAALGHSTISTTANIYLHAVESLQQEAADRINLIVADAIERAQVAAAKGSS